MITTPSAAQINHSGRAADGEVRARRRQRRPCDRTAQCHTETHADLPAGRRHRRGGPARSVGMPLTAALVIGALTIEKPMPNTAKITSSCHTGVVAVS